MKVKTVPRHVLIVEDNADSRETLRTLLSLWGHQVDVADTGPHGVEKALSSPPEPVSRVRTGLWIPIVGLIEEQLSSQPVFI